MKNLKTWVLTVAASVSLAAFGGIDVYRARLGGLSSDSMVVTNVASDADMTNVASSVVRAFSPKKLSKYLWELDCSRGEWDKATNRLSRAYPSYKPFGCTGLHAGHYHGRNLDWTYDHGATFVVRAGATESSYASIGVADGIAALTDDFVASGAWSPAYDSLPFTWSDGMNSCGVVVQQNVLQTMTEKSAAWRTNSVGRVICFAIVRYVLDRCSTALAAANMINEKVFVPSEFAYDMHFLVSDATSSYIVEDGHVYAATSATPTDLMTNFRIGGVTVDATTKKLDWGTVETYGMGLERYDRIRGNGNDNTTLEGMVATMKDVWYTKTYLTTTSPRWNTEFCETNTTLTVSNAKNNPSVFDEVFATNRADYTAEHTVGGARYRGGTTWQTVHTSVYDQNAKTLRIWTQEDADSMRIFYMNENREVGGLDSDAVKEIVRSATVTNAGAVAEAKAYTDEHARGCDTNVVQSIIEKNVATNYLASVAALAASNSAVYVAATNDAAGKYLPLDGTKDMTGNLSVGTDYGGDDSYVAIGNGYTSPGVVYLTPYGVSMTSKSYSDLLFMWTSVLTESKVKETFPIVTNAYTKAQSDENATNITTNVVTKAYVAGLGLDASNVSAVAASEFARPWHALWLYNAYDTVSYGGKIWVCGLDGTYEEEFNEDGHWMNLVSDMSRPETDYDKSWLKWHKQWLWNKYAPRGEDVAFDAVSCSTLNGSVTIASGKTLAVNTGATFTVGGTNFATVIDSAIDAKVTAATNSVVGQVHRITAIDNTSALDGDLSVYDTNGWNYVSAIGVTLCQKYDANGNPYWYGTETVMSSLVTYTLTYVGENRWRLVCPEYDVDETADGGGDLTAASVYVPMPLLSVTKSAMTGMVQHGKIVPNYRKVAGKSLVNDVTLGTLTINGQTYDGSADKTIYVDSGVSAMAVTNIATNIVISAAYTNQGAVAASHSAMISALSGYFPVSGGKVGQADHYIDIAPTSNSFKMFNGGEDTFEIYNGSSLSVTSTRDIYFNHDLYVGGKKVATSNMVESIIASKPSPLSGKTYDFANGTNFTLRLYTALTNVIQNLGGTVTNPPNFN